jgi:DNA-binding response OmpR family regulator
MALIVEDDEDIGAIFAAALQQAGFTTEVITDGGVAMNRLAELTPGVVLLDLHLPTVSGPDILRYIRSEERMAQTRVVIATADPHMADLLRNQVTLVLDKPVSFVQLRVLSTRLRPLLE